MKFGRVLAKNRVLDGRHALDREAGVEAGWSYWALGRRRNEDAAGRSGLTPGRRKRRRPGA